MLIVPCNITAQIKDWWSGVYVEDGRLMWDDFGPRNLTYLEYESFLLFFLIKFMFATKKF